MAFDSQNRGLFCTDTEGESRAIPGNGLAPATGLGGTQEWLSGEKLMGTRGGGAHREDDVAVPLIEVAMGAQGY